MELIIICKSCKKIYKKRFLYFTKIGCSCGCYEFIIKYLNNEDYNEIQMS